MRDDGITIPPVPAHVALTASDVAVAKMVVLMPKLQVLLNDTIVHQLFTSGKRADFYLGTLAEMAAVFEEASEAFVGLALNQPEPPAQWYAVSQGDGNDGVSRMHYGYAVKTADPWGLALAAVLEQFEPGQYSWVIENADFQGDPDDCITATLHEDPDGDPAINGGAWMAFEIFPIPEDDLHPPRDVKYEEFFDENIRATVEREAANI